jgi:hypothetical protein
MERHGLDCSGSGYGQVREACEYGNEQFSRSWFRASSIIILNKNQPDAH